MSDHAPGLEHTNVGTQGLDVPHIVRHEQGGARLPGEPCGERGAHLPSIESLLAVADALGTKPSEWFSSAGF